MRARWGCLTCVTMIIIAIHAPRSAHAQAIHDNKVWFTGETIGTLYKPLKLRVEQRLRLEDTGAGFEETFTEIGLRYRVLKHVQVGAAYRFIVLQTETRHRGAAELLANGALGRLKPEYRLRVQDTTNPTDPAQLAVRNRIMLFVKTVHHIEPFLAGEMIHVVSPQSELREIDAWIGLDWIVAKHVELEGYVMRQQEYNVTMPEVNNVFGIEVAYRFKVKHKHKHKHKHDDTPDEPHDR